jgi:REP element-mobilizing transposase RayT
MVRGIEKRRIFEDDCDRRDLLERLGRILPEAGMTCFAWALMPNHVHLVLRTGTVRLAHVMARLNTGYARRFNTRHARVGYLFQNRYKSILIEQDEYLLGLVRYVHLNPLRAGLVGSLESLGRYCWTGHATLLGEGDVGFQNTKEILEQFGATTSESRRRLLAWMRSDLASPLPAPEYAFSPEDEWRRARAASVGEQPSPARSPHLDRVRAPCSDDAGQDLSALIAAVCVRNGVRVDDLLAGVKSRPVAHARAEIVYRAGAELQLSGVAIARALRLTTAAVSQARARGRALIGSSAPSRETT